MTDTPVLFKGAGPGTHWHRNDARLSGFTAAATRSHTRNAVISHIVAYSHPSPYISVTTSFAVARQYALSGPGGLATSGNPGYVYEIGLSACTSRHETFNPVEEISKDTLAHEHNGDQNLILGVANSSQFPVLTVPVPHSGGVLGLPSVSQDIKGLVNALRDAEVLITLIPAGCIVNRHTVF